VLESSVLAVYLAGCRPLPHTTVIIAMAKHKAINPLPEAYPAMMSLGTTNLLKFILGLTTACSAIT